MAAGAVASSGLPDIFANRMSVGALKNVYAEWMASRTRHDSIDRKSARQASVDRQAGLVDQWHPTIDLRLNETAEAIWRIFRVLWQGRRELGRFGGSAGVVAPDRCCGLSPFEA